MKRIGPISCICSIVLLSACTSTRPQESMSAEDITAQLRAAAELDEALEKEEMRLIQEALAAEKAKAEEEARREAEEKAHEEAERKAEEAEAARLAAEEKAAEEAEQQARQAEEAARQDALAEKPAATPGLLTSRGKRRPADTAEKNIIPTAAQQEAARALLNKTTPPHPKAVRTPETAEKETPQAKQPEQPQEDVQLPGSVRNGVLPHRKKPSATRTRTSLCRTAWKCAVSVLPS